MTAQITYRLLVGTAAVPDAGTDATVRVQLIGDKGKSGEFELNNAGNDFEAGSQGVYTVTIDDIGALRQVRFFHDNSGAWPGWCLGRCQIHPDKYQGSLRVAGAVPIADTGDFWDAELPADSDAVTVPSLRDKNKRTVVGVWLSTDHGGVDKTFALKNGRTVNPVIAPMWGKPQG